MLRRVSCTVAIAMLGACPLHAETWTDATGKYKINADFVGYANGVVTLKRADGRVVQVPIAKLNASSKSLAQELAKRMQDSASIAQRTPQPPTQPKPADPPDSGTVVSEPAKTPEALAKKLANAFAKQERESLLACFYAPDMITQRLTNQEVDKAIAFVRLHNALARVDKQLGDDIFDREKYDDREAWKEWVTARGAVTRPWIGLVQPENIEVKTKKGKTILVGTYRKTTENSKVVMQGEFKIAQVDGEWFVDKRPTKTSVLRRLPQKEQDSWLQSTQDKIDAATRMADAFEKEAANITSPDKVVPAIQKAVEAKLASD